MTSAVSVRPDESDAQGSLQYLAGADRLGPAASRRTGEEEARDEGGGGESREAERQPATAGEDRQEAPAPRDRPFCGRGRSRRPFCGCFCGGRRDGGADPLAGVLARRGRLHAAQRLAQLPVLLVAHLHLLIPSRVFEAPDQGGACRGQPRGDRAGRHAEDPRRGVVVQAFLQDQEDHGPLDGRQRGQCGSQLEVPQGRLRGICGRLVGHHFDVRQGHHAATAALEVQAGAVRDLKQPGPDGTVPAELRQPEESLDGDLLQGIVEEVAVAEGAKREPAKARGIGVVDGHEGVGVPRAGGVHDGWRHRLSVAAFARGHPMGTRFPRGHDPCSHRPPQHTRRRVLKSVETRSAVVL